MGEKINNGGPAFPVCADPGARMLDGMTLRDYFAAKALAALIAEPIEQGGKCTAFNMCGEREMYNGLPIAEWVAKYHAEAAYMFADAMLAERDRSALAAYRVQGEGEGV